MAPGGGSGVFPKSRLRLYSSRAILSAAVTADDGENFARDVAGALGRGQKHVGGRDLLWLRGPLHRRVRAPNLLTSFACLSEGLRGVQTRARRHGIDPDAA